MCTMLLQSLLKLHLLYRSTSARQATRTGMASSTCPHERTLRDYRNHFKPEPGFVLENIQVLQSIVKSYEGAAKYVVLVFDEMKIKGKLVFDKHSGKLIGFTSLGDPDLDFSTFEELEVASHVLAFMVRGVQTTLKFMLAYFLTQTVVSYKFVPIF